MKLPTKALLPFYATEMIYFRISGAGNGFIVLGGYSVIELKCISVFRMVPYEDS
jgi:hypothetical protein